MKSTRSIVSACAMFALAGCSASVSQPGDGSFPGPPTGDAGKASVLAPLAPNVWLVHAASGVGDVRICLRDSDPVAQPDGNRIPSTNYAGLSPGQATVLHANLSAPLMGTVYDANDVARLESKAAYSCADLAKLQMKVKIPLAAVPVVSGPAVLALVGCPKNTPNGAQRCGVSYTDAGGNLELRAVPVATDYDSRAPMGAQVLNLSPTLADVPLVRWAIGALPQTGCATGKFSEGPAPVGAAEPSVATPLAAVDDFGGAGVSLCDTSMGRMSPILAASFVEQQRATEPASVPPEYFADKGNFVFTVVGEVGGTSPNALRVLALRFGPTH